MPFPNITVIKSNLLFQLINAISLLNATTTTEILESDWSSASCIRHVLVIGQLCASRLSNWTVRVMKHVLVALEWVGGWVGG